MIVAGVDVGGTNIEVGVVDDDHHVIDRAKADTPATGPDSVITTVTELVDSLSEIPTMVGVGIPGVMHDGEVLTVPNLAGWVNQVDLAAELEAQLRIPVTLGNDVNVGLLGEWVAGAAHEVDNVLGVWMGTGIGAALILDGRPFNGSQGAAGELGHVIVRPGGALCSCGRRGCVEAYAGRRSMAAVAAAMADAGRQTSLFSIQKAQGKKKPTSKVWAQALDESDELAQQLFDMAVETLGLAIASVVNMIDVELVVIGGGLAEKLGQSLADKLHAAATPWMLRPNPQLAFTPAALGDDSGVVGAAALARAAAISR